MTNYFDNPTIIKYKSIEYDANTFIGNKSNLTNADRYRMGIPVKYKPGIPEPTRPYPNPEICECCGKLNTAKRGLHLDHDHKNGKFRGWLCTTCNTGIGALGDNIEGVSKALDYILRVSVS